MNKLIQLLGIALVLVGLYGCALTSMQKFADFRNRNAAALMKLSVGMTMEEVQRVMGVDSVTGCNRALDGYGMICASEETFTNPAYTAAQSGSDGFTYVAWMYYTSRCGDQRGLHCLTPVVFRDGRVVGWGAEYMSTFKLDLKVH